MKLYTEEQVINFAISMISQYEFGNKNILNKELLKESLDCITPIEVPSDEEIKKIAIERFAVSMEDFGSEKIDGNEYFRSIFIQGIECFRDKIQGGNK